MPHTQLFCLCSVDVTAISTFRMENVYVIVCILHTFLCRVLLDTEMGSTDTSFYYILCLHLKYHIFWSFGNWICQGIVSCHLPAHSHKFHFCWCCFVMLWIGPTPLLTFVSILFIYLHFDLLICYHRLTTRLRACVVRSSRKSETSSKSSPIYPEAWRQMKSAAIECNGFYAECAICMAVLTLR